MTATSHLTLRTGSGLIETGDVQLPTRRPIIRTEPGPKSLMRRLSVVGMAVGYLGLVAILSTAPYWQQTIQPHEERPLVCTDFGGSR